MFVLLFLFINVLKSAMEEEILNISIPIVYGESIAHFEVHAHLPSALFIFNNINEI